MAFGFDLAPQCVAPCVCVVGHVLTRWSIAWKLVIVVFAPMGNWLTLVRFEQELLNAFFATPKNPFL